MYSGAEIDNSNQVARPSRDILHINVLELLAAVMSLRHFRGACVGRFVLVLMDNTTVAAYINRQGGTPSASLNALAAQLWRWFWANDIVPIANKIPGQDNLIADFLSRGKCLPWE